MNNAASWIQFKLIITMLFSFDYGRQRNQRLQKNSGKSTVISMTMLLGRYGAMGIVLWSASMASCEATRCHHLACACAILARRTPWSSPLPSCQNTDKTQPLASNYCTFLLGELSIFVTQRGPSTHVINATSFVTI